MLRIDERVVNLTYVQSILGPLQRLFEISSIGPRTATGLARLLDGQISHDQVTRFLASADVGRVVKPLVRQVESEDGALMVGEVALPVAFDVVTKTEEYSDPQMGRHKRRINTNARDRMLLSICVHNQIKFRYVLSDVWRASADAMRFLVPLLKKHLLMPLKENRQMATQSLVCQPLCLHQAPTREARHWAKSLCLDVKDLLNRLCKQLMLSLSRSIRSRSLRNIFKED